jgi:hypothetical protein
MFFLFIRVFLQVTSRVVRYSRDGISFVVSSPIYNWARPILAEAGAECLAECHALVVARIARYVG